MYKINFSTIVQNSNNQEGGNDIHDVVDGF